MDRHSLSREDRRSITEPSRELPISADGDVLVVGGGIAGIAASLAAARCGRSVILIERAGALGGLATLGLVNIYLPLCDGEGNQVIGGIAEELLKASILYGPGDIPECWRGGSPPSTSARRENRYRVTFNPASLALAAEELLLTSGVSILYDTRYCWPFRRSSAIEAVAIESKSGRSAITCRYVIDASGDADVCFTSGEETVSSGDNRDGSWFISFSDGQLSMERDYGETHYSQARPPGVRGYYGDSAEDVSDLLIQNHQSVLSVMRDRILLDRNLNYPVVIPTLPQFRTTRRLRGRTELREEDQRHRSADTVGTFGDWRKPGVLFYLPLSALTGVKNRNLAVAGRCISVSDPVSEMTRAIPVCALTGQVAGTLASHVVETGEPSDSVSPSFYDRLKESGVILAPESVSEP